MIVGRFLTRILRELFQGNILWNKPFRYLRTKVLRMYLLRILYFGKLQKRELCIADDCFWRTLTSSCNTLMKPILWHMSFFKGNRWPPLLLHWFRSNQVKIYMNLSLISSNVFTYFHKFGFCAITGQLRCTSSKAFFLTNFLLKIEVSLP